MTREVIRLSCLVAAGALGIMDDRHKSYSGGYIHACACSDQKTERSVRYLYLSLSLSLSILLSLSFSPGTAAAYTAQSRLYNVHTHAHTKACVYITQHLFSGRGAIKNWQIPKTAIIHQRRGWPAIVVVGERKKEIYNESESETGETVCIEKLKSY